MLLNIEYYEKLIPTMLSQLPERKYFNLYFCILIP